MSDRWSEAPNLVAPRTLTSASCRTVSTLKRRFDFKMDLTATSKPSLFLTALAHDPNVPAFKGGSETALRDRRQPWDSSSSKHMRRSRRRRMTYRQGSAPPRKRQQGPGAQDTTGGTKSYLGNILGQDLTTPNLQANLVLLCKRPAAGNAIRAKLRPSLGRLADGCRRRSPTPHCRWKPFLPHSTHNVTEKHGSLAVFAPVLSHFFLPQWYPVLKTHVVNNRHGQNGFLPLKMENENLGGFKLVLKFNTVVRPYEY
jgi:hypothetical protein